MYAELSPSFLLNWMAICPTPNFKADMGEKKNLSARMTI